MTKQIALSQQGKNKGQYFAIVDDEDFDRINQYRWCVMFRKTRSAYYAMRKVRINGRYKAIFMHRFIVNAPANMDVDHRNFDGCDNRRSNLRICTCGQNSQNRKISKNNKSGFKGVSWHVSRHKWQANICINRKPIYLGLFADPVSAARTYDAAALQYFGEFARLNFPQEAT